MKLADYVIVWTDAVPRTNGLADSAQGHGGELLAAGPVHDVSERDAREAQPDWSSRALVTPSTRVAGLRREATNSMERRCSWPVPPIRCGGRLRRRPSGPSGRATQNSHGIVWDCSSVS